MKTNDYLFIYLYLFIVGLRKKKYKFFKIQSNKHQNIETPKIE